MKAFKKVICGIALASLAMGAGVAAMSHLSESLLALADVVETEPVSELHLDQTKIKGYARNNYQTMEGHTGAEVTAYVFEADGNTAVNPEIRFVTEGTEGSTKVAYATDVTTAKFWYKLANTSEKDVNDGAFPYLLQVLDSQGEYPLLSWQPVVDGAWHSWVLQVPATYQSRFAGFLVKMGDLNGQLVIADIELNVAVEANEIGVEPASELHLDQTKVKGYTRHNYQSMAGHTGADVATYVFGADGNTSANPEIRFVTEGTEGSTKVAYDSPVTTAKFWYKLTNSTPKNVADGEFPYLLQVLDSEGTYPLINWQPVVDGEWHSWCLQVPADYQSRFAGFVVKMGDITGELVVADIEINVGAEANQIGYFEITKFSSWNCFDNTNEMLLMQTTGTDFPDASVYNVPVNVDILNDVGFYADLKAVNDPFKDLIGGQSYLNHWVRPGVLTFMPADSRTYTVIHFPQGLRLPSYNYIQNGVPTYYALKDAMVANRISDEHPTNIDVLWSLERDIDESLILGDFTITKVQSYRAYSGDPANGNEQVLVWVSGTDYVDVDGEGSMQQRIPDEKFPNMKAKFYFGSQADESVSYLPNIIAGEFYHNFTTRHPLFSFAPENVLNIDKIVFKAGLLIPSYSYISGGAESYYRLSYETTCNRLEAHTDSGAWNNWNVFRDGFKLGDFTLNSVQFCGTSNEGWGFGWTWIILRFNESDLFNDYGNYNVNNSAYVSEEFYLNKIKVNGQFLSAYSTEILESFRANAIGQNQFGIVFEEGFVIESFELLPGCRFPAANTFDYFEMNQHLIKSVHSGIFDAAELDAFGETYMHPEIEESDIGTGLCTSEGWYADAKAAFMGMEEWKRAVMYDYPEYYGWVLTRLAAWARANGDSLQGWNIVDGAHRITPAQQNVAINVSIIVVCASISLVAGVAILLTIKKRKHQR